MEPKFLPLEDNMHTQQNQPNASFLVKIETLSGEHVAWYRVDQVLTNHRDSRAWARMAEVIKADLRGKTAHFQLKHLLFHYCLAWHMDDFVKEHNIEVS